MQTRTKRTTEAPEPGEPLYWAVLDPRVSRTVGKYDRIAVAVSGGPDSMALLYLAVSAFGSRIDALTVDHRLRAQSGAEAVSVGRTCDELGVAHAVLPWLGRKPVAGRPAAARAARYRLMRDWCAHAHVRWLMTAHHADDQAETIVMRLARGAGVGGLAGVRFERSLGRGVRVLRPLLGIRKAALVALCARQGLPTVDDPSNRDPAYARTAARTLLARTPWLDAANLAASATHLADAEAALVWAAERAWAGRATVDEGVVCVDADDLPRELRLRLLKRALVTAAPAGTAPRGPDLARLLARLDGCERTTLAGAVAEPGPPWRFVAEPQRDPSRATGRLPPAAIRPILPSIIEREE